MSATCAYENCGRPVHNNGAECIFHAAEKDPQEFRNALAAQIRLWRSEKAKKWNFRDWVFVDVERERKYVWQRHNLFARAVFPVHADFTAATFTKDANFDSATFTGAAVFESATFTENADFRNATFTGDANFKSATFTGDAFFNSATFKRDANFFSVTFNGTANFFSVTFKRNAIFFSATFKRDVVFFSAMFKQYAWFNSATFTEDAFFRSVTFTENAFFRSATFAGDAFFESATFAGYAWFDSATFRQTLDLSYVSFAVLGDFSHVVIGGAVRLEWPGEGYKPNKEGRELRPGRLLLENVQFPVLDSGEPGTLDLRDNALREDSPLIIKNTDMRRVLLTGTDCRRIEFYNCETWAKLKGRRAVADEVFLRTDVAKFGGIKPSWSEIAITYQQLVVNFRKELDHPLANDFERGLFEARRQSAKTEYKRGQFLLYSAYKWVSNYSGSIWRPLAWTLLVTVICGLLYGAILYDGQFVWPWQSDWGLMCKSAAASLRTVTLDRGLIIREIGALNGNEARLLGASLTAAFQIIVTATLITLLIFSIRRRFKHSE